MSGVALLSAIRSAGQVIPSVMATAWIADPETEGAGQSGLTKVLGKPIDIQGLLSMMRMILDPPRL